MPGRKFRVPEDMLPFAEKLSPEEKKRWIREWHRLLWRSPRYVAIFAVVAIACLGFFALFMPPWQFTPEVWSRCVFGIGELGVAYVLAEFFAYGFSKPAIEARMSAEFQRREKA
jgi:hypothetical protein